MVSNRDSLVRELILLDGELKPLQARFEDLKREVRELGADVYTVAGLGAVTVTRASESRPKGTALELNLDAWQALPPARQAELVASGIVRTVTLYTQARAAAVKVEHFADQRAA